MGILGLGSESARHSKDAVSGVMHPEALAKLAAKLRTMRHERCRSRT